VWLEQHRKDRLYNAVQPDQRNDFQRDRDRVLYSSAFHRLAGVTQIVRAGEEEIFHNRQQHTIKVAQVGRRLAQRCISDFKDEAYYLGVDDEVVEAACLAHDLGHPPFGHVGEHVLDELTKEAGDPNGFEGNAQTFRIITRLGVRFRECEGLDLTRATLAACLKYPWLRDESDEDKKSKWSAYEIDAEAFYFARQFHRDDKKTAEAALMDWADDIAYSVHDLEDFHRCGAIPWMQIFEDGNSREVVTRAHKKWHGAPPDGESLLSDAFTRLKEDIFLGTYESLMTEVYRGSREQRLQLRNLTSQLIGHFIKAASLNKEGPAVTIGKDEEVEVLIHKQITRDYIISNPSLAAQQVGQKKVLTDLHSIILDASSKGFPPFLPVKFRHIWEICDGAVPRFVADCIASLTEKEALALHARLVGIQSGSVLDPIIR